MSWDEYLPDPPEPDYPEPTDEEYCAMSGHERYWENPETLGDLCHCTMVLYPTQGEYHDDYSAYCASLIDAYVDTLWKKAGRTNAIDTRPSLRFDIGKELRHKSPAYLQSLINSLNDSGDQMAADWHDMTEGNFDFFVKIGCHLNHSGSVTIQTLIHRLGGSKYIQPESLSEVTCEDGWLDQESNLEAIRCASKFYVRLIPSVSGWRWREEFMKLIDPVLPLLLSRPDLMDAIVSFYGKEGYSEASTERVLGMAATAPVATTLTEGFL